MSEHDSPAGGSQAELDRLRGRIAQLEDELARERADRHRQVQALAESEERYRLHFENASDVICALDREMRITSISPSVLRVVGYPAEGLIGRPFAETGIIHPGDISRALTEATAVLRGQTMQTEFRTVHRDGHEVVGEFNASPLLSGGEIIGLVVVIRDITERRRAKQERGHQLRLWQTLIDAIPQPVFYKDLDRRYLGCNEAFCRGLGLKREQIVGRRAEDIVAPELADEYRAKDEELLRTGGSQTYEFSKPDAEGRRQTVIFHRTVFQDEQAAPAGLVSTSTDITWHKRLEEDLRLSEAKIRALLAALPDRVVRISRDGTYLETLSQKETAVWLNDGVVGKKVEQVPPPDRATQIRKALNATFATGQVQAFEYEVTLPSGDVRCREGRVAMVKEDEAIIVIRDITAAKRAEEALRRTADELQTLMELAPTPIWVADAPDCRAMRGNREAYRLNELPVPADLSVSFESAKWRGGRRFFRNKVELSMDQLPLQRAAAEGVEIRGEEIEVALPSGRRVAILGNASPLRDANGRIRGAISSFTEITERKRMEDELRRSEARNRAIIAALPDTMYSITRGAVYGPMISDRGFKPIYPWSEYYQGRRVRDVTPPEFADRIDALIAQAFETGQVQTIEYDLLDPHTGQTRYREARYSVSGPDELLCLARDITARKRAEQQLRSLASQLSLAEERERRRIAGQLHDRIGQALALAKIQLGHVRRARMSAHARSHLEQALGLIEQTIADARSLTFELSPPILYELGFEPAVEWLAEQVARQYEVQIDVQDDGRRPAIPDDLRIVLFQAFRELLINAAKHAQAGLIRVATAHEERHIRLEIADDGIGFDPAAVERTRHGFGLFSIGERLASLGGRLEIESSPGKGSRLVLTAATGA
jgi:PAS domain S-box-containing protein